MKAPFLSISDTVMLKYSQEKETRSPKYTSRDRWKYISIVLNLRDENKFALAIIFAPGSSVPEPIARTDDINYPSLSTAVSYRVIGCSTMTSVRGIGMSHRGDRDNVEIGSDGNDANYISTLSAFILRSISRRERASTANWSCNFFFFFFARTTIAEIVI